VVVFTLKSSNAFGKASIFFKLSNMMQVSEFEKSRECLATTNAKFDFVDLLCAGQRFSCFTQ
jgi:hypothetical protein